MFSALLDRICRTSNLTAAILSVNEKYSRNVERDQALTPIRKELRPIWICIQMALQDLVMSASKSRLRKARSREQVTLGESSMDLNSTSGTANLQQLLI